MITGIAIHYLIKELKHIEGRPIRDVLRDGDIFRIVVPEYVLNIVMAKDTQSIYISEERNLSGTGFFSSHFFDTKIISIEQHDLDRVMIIDTGKVRIIAEFFERHGDLILIQRNDIIFSIRGKSGIYTLPVKIDAPDILSSPAEELKNLIIGEEKIKGLTLSFTKYLKTLGEDAIDEFLKRQFKPCFNHLTFSPFFISGFEEAGSMNDAVRGFLELKREDRERKRLENYLRSIDRKIQALRKSIDELKNPVDYEKYRYYGDLLMTYASALKRENPVKVKGFMGEDVVIDIDPSKTIQENARDYYRKYKKAKAREEKKNEMIARIEREIERLEQMREHAEIPEKPGRVQTEKPYREFTTENGYKILVGKNAKGNELITFRIAKPYDLFFHVREAPGSHVILRLKEKGKRPPERDIKRAASIAAWFSKAKHSNLVPVQFTEVRYLRKPKKGKQGKVILTREEVIFVQPERPEST